MLVDTTSRHGLQNTMYIGVKMLIVDLEAGLQYADM